MRERINSSESLPKHPWQCRLSSSKPQGPSQLRNLTNVQKSQITPKHTSPRLAPWSCRAWLSVTLIWQVGPILPGWEDRQRPALGLRASSFCPSLTLTLLSSQLAHCHPGSAEPPVRPPAEERDHLVCALSVGVTAVAPGSSVLWTALERLSLMTPHPQPSPPTLCPPVLLLPPRQDHLPGSLGPGGGARESPEVGVRLEQGLNSPKIPLFQNFLPSPVSPSPAPGRT